MEKIENYNCEGMCIQKECSNKHIYSTTAIINGIEVVLMFCEKHALEYDKGTFMADLINMKEKLSLKDVDIKLEVK